MLKFSEFFAFSKENSYFERIRMVRLVRMVRMVRSLADRTFQLRVERAAPLVQEALGRDVLERRRGSGVIDGPRRVVYEVVRT